ncbi:MAG: 6-phosphogluconolactonase [Planctomycetaceae bacterium]
MSRAPVETFASLDLLNAAVLRAFVELSQRCIAQRGVFRVSLSGGSTPKRLYQSLASEALDWDRIQWFWGDERNVPHDHSDSNFRMVREAMLEPAAVPASTYFPVPVEPECPASAALNYENTLRRQFGSGQAMPAWDLVLLGMGDDAHTASLFPGTKALDEQQRWFVENWVEKFDAYRYTLTAPAINSGREIWFLVSGPSKREPLARVLEGERHPSLYPSQLISPTRWFVTNDVCG